MNNAFFSVCICVCARSLYRQTTDCDVSRKIVDIASIQLTVFFFRTAQRFFFWLVFINENRKEMEIGVE